MSTRTHLVFLFIIHFISSTSCGRSRPNSVAGEALISHGKRAHIEDFPWHVGIYRHAGGTNYELDCGGSLITTKHVISAAHCFWDEILGKMKSKDLYQIALGKNQRDWSTAEPGVNRVPVEEILVQRQFRGRLGNFQYDIAVVQMQEEVQLSSYINVVNIDWLNEFTQSQLVKGKNGTVVGWGYTEDGTVSAVLRSLELPYVSGDNCSSLLDRTLQHLVTPDKFCAGYIGRNVSVCRGDSGGGLVFYNEANSKYYLRGVVSVNFKPAHVIDPCYAQHVTGFTLVTDPLTLRWVKHNSRLVIDCGVRVRNPGGEPLIAGGINAFNGEFPWHAGVYRKRSTSEEYMHICGATLITTKHVVTAGHCLYNTLKQRAENNVTHYKVALGKYFRSWSTKEDFSQLMDVEEMIVHSRYNGKLYSYDIGVIKLATDAQLTGYVNAMCVDWENQFDDVELSSGRIGIFTGWGFTENGDQSKVLQSIQMPRVTNEVCANLVPEITQNYLTWDKFCAGYVGKNLSICLGDSGGGFVVLNAATETYFLRGIASISFAERNHDRGGCATSFHSGFTRLSAHLNWLKSAVGYDSANRLDVRTALTSASTLTSTSSTTASPMSTSTSRRTSYRDIIVFPSN